MKNSLIIAALILTCGSPAFADAASPNDAPPPDMCLTVHPAIDADHPAHDVKPKKHNVLDRAVTKVELYQRAWPRKHPVAHRRLKKTWTFTNNWILPAMSFGGNVLQIVKYL